MGKNYVYKDRSIPKLDNLQIKIREDFPWTERQMEFNSIAQAKGTKLMFVNGPCGTTKTFLAVYNCVKLLIEGKIDQILYVRSLVESSDNSMGYLKGGMDEKFCPYMAPLEDKLSEILTKTSVINIKKKELVKAMPFNFLRGSHFTNKGVIVDESQNATTSELTTLITRLGDYNKVFICGDEMQTDISQHKTGFTPMLDLFDENEAERHGIKVFEFDQESDILRSELVKFIVKKLRDIA